MEGDENEPELSPTGPIDPPIAAVGAAADDVPEPGAASAETPTTADTAIDAVDAEPAEAPSDDMMARSRASIYETIAHEHVEHEPVAAVAPRAARNDEELIFEAVALLSEELGIRATVDDRVIRLTDPVPGMPHLAVIQALGFAAKAGPVGAAAHGPAGVAAAVWESPRLLISRWTGASRWVSAYKFPARSRPDDYLREDTGIPSHMNKGSWYAAVPDDIAEAFFSVGLLLDEPPFPVPKPPPPAPKPETTSRAGAVPRERTARTPAAPREPRAPSAPRAARPKPPPVAKKAAPPTTRTCATCNLQKHVSQFIAGSDECVDCR